MPHAADLIERAVFFLDAYEGVEFEGYTLGEWWNGFECPLFPFESGQRIVEVSGVEQTAFYDESADQFVFAETDDENDPERFAPVHVEGVGKLYPIGARVWTWDRK